MLAVLILVAVVSVFVGWAALQGNQRGIATPDATALHPADVELLSRTAANGYKRANCHHAHSSGAIASFLCAANPATGDPAAQFLRYSSLDNLNDAYMTFRRNYRATACTGDPAGPDGPSAFHDAEAGRKACFVDHGDPATPKPALVLTNTGLLAMAVYTWDTPNGEALRDYVAQHDDLAQFQNSAGAQDPDSFTPADLALLTEVGAGYSRANCRHEHPQDPNTMADTRIACSLADGFALAFVSYPDRQTAIMRYQARLAQVSGRRCGGSGTDDGWNRAGSPVGRLFCYDDVTGSGPQHPCLQAVHNDPALAVVVCTLQPDDPHEGPRTEAELGAWFQRQFG